MANITAGTVKAAWGRLESWCLRHNPRLVDALNPGASEEEIDAVEQAIGQPLPAEIRESLSIHNGQIERGNPRFFGYQDLLSATTIVVHWQDWRGCEDYNEEFRDHMSSSPEQAIALDYANPGWIPLASDAGGNHFGVDLAPGPAGTRGQVIIFGRNENRKCVLADNWGEFLTGFAAFLESDAFDGIQLDHEDWTESVQMATGDRLLHEVLAEVRREGKWTHP